MEDPEYKLRLLTLQVEARLFQSLPPYMVPSVYMPLATMPTLPTGKTNRRLLREIGSALDMDLIAALRPPQELSRQTWTQNEQRMQRLWAAILGMDVASIHLYDNFFHIGGDSVAAMKLIAGSSKEGLLLTVQDVFKHPCLVDLAQIARVSSRAGTSEGKPNAAMVMDVPQLPYSELLQYINVVNVDSIEVTSATSFQKDVVAKHFLQPSQHLNYWYLDLPSEAVMDHVKLVCEQLVHQFDIFRAVFVEFKDQILQVTPRDLEVPIITLKLDGNDIDTNSGRICREDLAKPVALGKSFLSCWIFESENQRKRLIMRLSHAQYDGISLGFIVAAFVALYSGVEPKLRTSFSQYTHHLAQHQHDRRLHWRTLLEGSHMTSLRANPGIQPFPECENLAVVKIIPHLNRVQNVTMASIFTTACAVTLGAVAGVSDVVFGRLVSGRAGLWAEDQDIVGPCMNVIPVRLRLDQRNDVVSLSNKVQKQYVDSAPYEATGLDEIVQDCTPWPASTTHFGAISQYQNIDDTFHMKLGREACNFHYWVNKNAQPWYESIYMLGTPLPEGLRVYVAGSSMFYDQKIVADVHERLCAILTSSNSTER